MRTRLAATRAPTPASPSVEDGWGYAIRRAWRNGSHDLFGFTTDRHQADRALARDHRFWRSGPVRPAAVYVVATPACAVIAHPVDGCRSSSCPDSLGRGEVR
ncbi:hypothetical protein O3597_25980 [Verrucosispora sp. WMMA2044]|uniref:hypothetical protein n=1 Tax=Verrucosispora sp. WMMA2044 TaxID=3016419 RepID=UPI00248BB2F4|nr:hypothetical protein [Verrucosispora sp. WMMA2044]WBB48491.1 hypothetical protein O3597_25980 [Verrucosispora sp. WMMA2044]